MSLKSWSGWVKVIESYTSEFLVCHFLLVINCTRGRIGPHHEICPRPEILYRSIVRYSRHVHHRSILLPLLRLTPTMGGFHGTTSVKFCTEVSGWLRYTAVKKYRRKLPALLTTETPMTLNPGSEWIKVIESYTSEFLMCHFLLIIKIL